MREKITATLATPRGITEKEIEAKLVSFVKKAGGLAVKFWAISFVGFPDRIVLMPGGKVWFVEVKKPGKKPSKIQAYVHEQLRTLGFSVLVVDSPDEVTNFINSIV